MSRYLNSSDRKTLRAEAQARWTVYVPTKPGVPFTKKDLADADEALERREEARLRAEITDAILDGRIEAPRRLRLQSTRGRLVVTAIDGDAGTITVEEAASKLEAKWEKDKAIDELFERTRGKDLAARLKDQRAGDAIVTGDHWPTRAK